MLETDGNIQCISLVADGLNGRGGRGYEACEASRFAKLNLEIIVSRRELMKKT